MEEYLQSCCGSEHERNEMIKYCYVPIKLANQDCHLEETDMTKVQQTMLFSS